MSYSSCGYSCYINQLFLFVTYDLGAGNVGIKEVMVGIVAVFDGHNGAEASEMSSRLLLEYFLLHTYFLLDATYSVLLKKPGGSFQYTREHGTVPQVHDWDYVLGRHELNFGRFFLNSLFLS